MKTADPMRYREIARQLQEQVQRGELKPGERLPSFVQMRAQGLSQHTMEKAYALLESEGVIERQGGSGIYVSQPRPVEPAMIGAFGPTPPQYEAAGGHLYWMQLLAGVQDEAQKSGATVVLLGEDTRSAAWEKVDCALLYALSDKVLDRLPPGLRAVSLVNRSKRIAWAGIDDEGAAREATEHLLQLGHRRIATFTVEYEASAKRRVRGYRAALKESGITPEPGWVRRIHGDKTSPHYATFATRPFNFFRDGRERMEEWLAGDFDALGITAILALNDQTALGILAALHQAGRRVPEEISVVGFDGTEAADHSHPRLTTVRMPLHDIGAQGTRMLLDQLKPGAVGQSSLLLPTQLRIAESTAACRQRAL